MLARLLFIGGAQFLLLACPAPPALNNGLPWLAQPATAKTTGELLRPYMALTHCAGRPVIAFRSWYSAEGINDGDLVMATTDLADPHGENDWLLTCDNVNQVAKYGETGIDFQVSLTTMQDRIGGVWWSDFDKIGLGILTFSSVTNSEIWSSSEIPFPVICFKQALAFDFINDKPALLIYQSKDKRIISGEVSTGLYLAMSAVEFPAKSEDWSTHYTGYDAEPTPALLDCVNGDILAFAVIEGNLVLLSSPDPTASSSRWNRTTLFPVQTSIRPMKSCTRNGYYYILALPDYYFSDPILTLARCAVRSIKDSSAWEHISVDFSPLFLEEAEFVEDELIIAVSDLPHNDRQTKIQIGSIDYATGNQSLSTSLVIKGTTRNLSISVADTYPAIAYFCADPDRICYAYAKVPLPRTSKDWHTCTVVKHDIKPPRKDMVSVFGIIDEPLGSLVAQILLAIAFMISLVMTARYMIRRRSARLS